MRIAFVYDAVYPWVKGGAEKRIYELGKRLAKQGHEVHVFGIKWWGGEDTVKNEGMVLHGVCAPMQLYVNGRRSITEAIVFAIRLFPHMIRERFDVIDVSAFPYFPCFAVKIVSVLRGIPMVITWHEVWGGYWYEYLGFWGFFGKLVEYLTAKLTSNHTCVSALTGNNLESLGVKNIRVLPNGIDSKIIAGIRPSAQVCDVIFIGRLIREKNVELLLEAVAIVRKSMPGVKCHIIGDGPERESLIRYATGLGLIPAVRFFGFMDYTEMISRIKSAKLLALPSSREGFGIVVIEAFACGVPVLTTRNRLNAASLLVGGETGRIVNPDARELSDAILGLVMDDGLRKKMAGSAIMASQEYDWDNIINQLAVLYKELARK